MEHTNLFLYESLTAMTQDYPNGKVDNPDPGVAYARAASVNDDFTVFYNQKKMNYTVTLSFQDRSGNTISANTTVESPLTLEGMPIKMNINAPEFDGYKAIVPVEKIEVSGDTTHLVLYYVATSYTVTVNHMFSGQSIACATTILVDNVYEEDVARVTIEPENISGYKASAVTIYVSGDTTYDLEYVEDICYVDLGLPSGTLWACKNLGAQTPQEFGNEYAWGEIVANRGNYCDDGYYEFGPFVDGQGTKYNETDNKVFLDLEDDAAYQALGGGWHIPTVMQISELINHTIVTNEEYLDSGICFEFTSTENGEKLYITCNDADSGQTMWTNTLACGAFSYALQLNYGSGYYPDITGDFARSCSNYIRPVLGEGPTSELDDPNLY